MFYCFYAKIMSRRLDFKMIFHFLCGFHFVFYLDVCKDHHKIYKHQTTSQLKMCDLCRKKILNMHLFLLLVEIYEKETVTFRENGNLNIDTYLYITCSVESIIFSWSFLMINKDYNRKRLNIQWYMFEKWIEVKKRPRQCFDYCET